MLLGADAERRAPRIDGLPALGEGGDQPSKASSSARSDVGVQRRRFHTIMPYEPLVEAGSALATSHAVAQAVCCRAPWLIEAEDVKP